MSRPFRLLLQLAFGVALLIIWAKAVDFSVLSTHLSRVDFRYVGLTFILGFLGGILRFARLQIVLSPIIKVPILPLYMIGLASGFFNFVLAMRAGELTKGYYLKKLYGSSFSKATAAVVVDRVADFLVIIATVFVLVLLGGKGYFPPGVLIIIFLLPLLGLYLLAWEGKRILSYLEKIIRKIKPPYLEKILYIFKSLLEGFSVAKRDPKTLGIVLILTFSALILEAAGLSFLFRAFGVEIGLLSALLANGLFALSFLIPSPPGYIGTVEVAGSLIFVLALGVDKNLAASVALFFHVYAAFFAGILGLPAVVYLQLLRRKGGTPPRQQLRSFGRGRETLPSAQKSRSKIKK